MLTIRFAICIIGVALASFVCAQPYPSKLIRIVNPFPAGGPADTLVRPIAQRMGEGLKVQCLVDNRPGVNGIIGTELVVKSPADGYTLVVGSTSSLPMNAAIYPKMPFDPVSFGVFIYAAGVGGASLGAGTFSERVDRARPRAPGPVDLRLAEHWRIATFRR